MAEHDPNRLPELQPHLGHAPDGRDAGSVPVARPAGGGSRSGAAADSDRLTLELAEATCPKCFSRLSDDAVVCVKCGYDLRANVVREPVVGVDEVPIRSGAASDDDVAAGASVTKPDFVPPARGGLRSMLWIGGVLTIGAAALGGYNAYALGGTTLLLAKVLLIAYSAVVGTATGVIAILVASMLYRQRYSRTELVAARMLVITAAFLLISNVEIGGLPAWIKWLVPAVIFGTAAVVYWLLVMVLFKKDRQPAAAVMVVHAGLWLLLALGMLLAAWVNSAMPKGPTP